MAELPDVLKENSGICYRASGIWLHNDSGDKPFLYKITPKDSSNSDYILSRQIYVGNSQNIDWEDITQDDSGNIYIGDFGNNYNQRKDLCIYKIKNPDSSPNDTLIAERIDFNYPDQSAFPPPARHRHYDMEAMVVLGDALYLFSKNRTQPHDGWVKIYRLPTIPGKYEAVLIDSVQLSPHSFLNSITGAALSPDGRKLALLSMTKIHLFIGFQPGSSLTKTRLKMYKLPFSQKEAIDFMDNRTLLISDEKSPFGRPKLYRLRLK